MIAIVLTGIVAYRQLPVSALPQVDYPTIQVVTFYPGASPDAAASAIVSLTLTPMMCSRLLRTKSNAQPVAAT